jgi:PAS domain S-box-containing protein
MYLWLFSFSWMYSATDEGVALWWAKFAYLGVPFIPSSIYHFTVTILGTYEQRKRLVWLSWLLSLFFSVSILSTDALIKALYQYWWGYYPRYGWLSLPYLIFFFGILIITLHDFWQGYRQAPPGTTHKRRVKAFFITFAVVYIGSVDYIAKFGIAFYPFGYVPVLIFLVLAARLIWTYRLVKITPSFAAEQIMATMIDPLLVCDADRKIRMVNEATCMVFGYTEQELIDKPIKYLLDQPTTKTGRLIHELLQQGRIRDEEMVLKAKSGQPIEVSISVSHLHDQDRAVVGAVIIARDIRERKQAEETLRSSERYFRSLIENGSDFIYVLKSDGTIHYVSPSVERRLGFRPEELIGQNGFHLIHPDDIQGAQEAFAGAIQDPGIDPPVELRIRHKDGSWRVLEGAANNLLHDPAVAGIVINAFDITERKQAEAALRESEERLRAFADALPDLAFILDKQGRHVEILTGQPSLLRVSVEKMKNRLLHEILPKKEADDLLTMIQRTIELNEPQVLEYVLDVPVGRRWFEGRTAPLPQISHPGEMVVLISRDITERKLLEQQLYHAQKMEAVGHLAGGVAHNFNNMLTTMMGYVGLAIDALPADHPVSPDLQMVQKSAQKAAALTSQLLAFTRDQPAELKILNFNDLILDIEPLLRQTAGAAIHLVLCLDPALGLVKLDPNQFTQVLLNLVINGRDAMPNGGRLTLTTANVTVDQQNPIVAHGHYILISVMDTGVGMSEEVKNHLFEPFFTTKEVGKGAGLGLATCFGIIQQCKGYITVQSEPGEGTTFDIYLPRLE